jgi:hypothetical protein
MIDNSFEILAAPEVNMAIFICRIDRSLGGASELDQVLPPESQKLSKIDHRFRLDDPDDVTKNLASDFCKNSCKTPGRF